MSELNRFSSGSSWLGIAAILSGLIGTGCLPIRIAPVAGRPSGGPFQSGPTLQAELMDRSTYPDLVSKFGPAVVEDPEKHWAVFRVCKSDKKWWWIWVLPLPIPPIPLPDGGTQCNSMGFWFGSNGKVSRIEAWWDDFFYDTYPKENDPDDLSRLRKRMQARR